MATQISWAGAVAACAALTFARGATASPKRGTFTQTDSLGMNVVSYNLDTKQTTTVADAAALSEFFGVHYFVLDGVRVGVNFQFSEYLTEPGTGRRRIATFAALPQVGLHVWGPFFAAVVLTIAPWTGGKAEHDLGVQAVFGGAYHFGRVSLTGALEVPYNFLVHRTIGLTPLVGLSIRLN